MSKHALKMFIVLLTQQYFLQGLLKKAMFFDKMKKNLLILPTEMFKGCDKYNYI